MTRAAELLEACDHGDEVKLERLGWHTIWGQLNTWPGRSLTLLQLRGYADQLGHEDPQAISAALRALRENPYMPSAAEIARQLRSAQPEPGRAAPARPDRAPHTDTAVRMAAAAGEPVCDCHPRSPQWLIDRDGVLRCPDCRGLEVGQYETALDSEGPQTPDSAA